MDVTIRKGEEKDLPAVLGLVKELAEFEKAPGQVINTVDKMIKEQKYFDFFVAELNGEIIAMALYFFAYYTWVGKALYLDDIYVKKQFRGKKVGMKLLKEVFRVAEKENCSRIRWQVLNWNKDAITFYEKINAEIDDEWLNCDFDRQGIKLFLDNFKI